jgi:uncharacterized membrane protein YbaN (DUF454 family)
MVHKILLFRILGLVFVAIALVGVILPLLPTTPFLLLAAACFARSSERWHRWLISNRVFGPMIQDWHAKRCVSLRTKQTAILSIVVVGGYSVLFGVENPALRVLGLLVIAIGLYTVGRLRVCPR